jgi:hypothetical protein
VEFSLRRFKRCVLTVATRGEGRGEASLLKQQTADSELQVEVPDEAAPSPLGVPDKARAQLRGEASLSLPLSFSSSYYASLSPSERPSPFREGDILWINHLDDIDDDKRKMGDSIRYYPGMDPNEKNNQRAYEMRIQLEEKDRQEKEKAAAIRKEEMDKLMNMEIYYGYRDILKFMTSDIFAKVNIKGTEVNKMWFQYNLSQMERSEENRLLMTEAEFLRWHVTEAALKYMRRDG